MDTGKHRKNGQKFGLLISDTRASVILSQGGLLIVSVPQAPNSASG